MATQVTYQQFIADTYPNSKGILISIFSQDYPLKFNNRPRNEEENKELVYDGDGVKIDIDADYLRNLFHELNINAEVSFRNERTKDKIKKYINNLGQKGETTNYDAFIFVFLTYLSEEQFGNTIFRDDRIHLDDDLCSMQEFYDEVKKTDGMQLKPKIFLVQCDDLSLLYPKVYLKGEDEMTKPFKIPQDSDRLIIMSDIPQRLANPDKKATKKNPSFMIKAFGEALLENSKQGPMDQQDLLVLTTTINQKVSAMIKEQEEKETKEKVDEEKRCACRLSVPLITSTLTKLIKIQSVPS